MTAATSDTQAANTQAANTQAAAAPSHARAALLALLLAWPAAQSHAQAVQWPRYGPDRDLPQLDGFANTVPDVVGPIDGSARLTVFTEGNHYPVLLPLLFDDFPAWCRHTGRCDITAEQILAVTLPQVTIVEGLESGGFRFGNAVLPVTRDGAVFPDLVMGGREPLRKLRGDGLLEDSAIEIARTRGLGLLLRRDPRTDGVDGLDALAASDARVVIATPNERGARLQYTQTLDALVGEPKRRALLAREVAGFPGRLGIQHRDVPYALVNGLADAGIVFGHLARFYATRYPDALRFVEVPDAAPFGQTIAVARSVSTRHRKAADAFIAYLRDAAPAAYTAQGFAGVDDFAFGRATDLDNEEPDQASR